MAATQILCPQCASTFTSNLRAVVGAQLTCPRCQRSFQARPQDVKMPAAPPPPSGARSGSMPPPPLPGGRAPATSTMPKPPSVAPRPSTQTKTAPPPLPPRPPTPTATKPIIAPPEKSVPTKAILFGAGGFVLIAAAVAIPLMLQGEPKPTEVAKNDNPKSDPTKTADSKPKVKPTTPPVKPKPKTPPGTTKPSTSTPPKKKPTTAKKPSPPSTPPPSSPPPVAVVSPELQKKIDKAIAQGVDFLKNTGPGGRRGRIERLGCKAIRGLTLLECGVPRSDPLIQKLAKEIRGGLLTLTQTYDIALSILFFDRLGEYQDRRRIEGLGVKLLAGQKASGGWTYTCPKLTLQQEEQLYVAIQQEQPQNPLDMLELDQKDEQKLKPLLQNQVKKGEKVRRLQTKLPTPTPQEVAKLPMTLKPLYEKELPAGGKAKLIRPLQNNPSLNPVPKESDMIRADGTDNSNTQFAILGLWTARRYGVPMDRAMALIVKRFRKSQNTDGTWGYRYFTQRSSGGTHTMTCAGLLGLAVAHGLIVDAIAPGSRKSVTIKDPAIAQGMNALARFLEAAGRRTWHGPPLNLYLYWSIERVGVLYGKRYIGKTEWYREGAQVLVDQQQKDGTWRTRSYSSYQPLVDTCFALLFLKRANLVQDLTNKLEELLKN